MGSLFRNSSAEKVRSKKALHALYRYNNKEDTSKIVMHKKTVKL